MCNFHYLGYYCSPNLSIHQNSTQELTWNFLVTLNLCISSGFQWKKASLGVGSPWYVATGIKWNCSNASFFKVSLALCWGSLIPDFTKNLDNSQKCHNMDKVFMKSQAIMFSSSTYFVLCYTHIGLFIQNFEGFFQISFAVVSTREELFLVCWCMRVAK